MRKLFKIILGFGVIITFLFVISRTFADEKLEVVDMIQNDYYSAILYSDGSLYYWNQYHSMKLENVKEINYFNYNRLVFIDNDNNLKEKELYYEEIVDIASNVKSVSDNYYLTNNNELYEYYYDYEHKKVKIMNNVKSYVGTYNNLSILDMNDSLYGYGYNKYGKKINNGEEIKGNPILIAENVDNYEDDHYIDKNGDLYIFNGGLALPTKILSGVTNASLNFDALGGIYNFYIKDNKTYNFTYEIKDGKVTILLNSFYMDEELYTYSLLDNWYYDNCLLLLSKNGNLYNYFNKDIISKDVKQMWGNIYLNNDGELYSLSCERYSNCKSKYLMNNISKIINSSAFIMNDGTILTNGSYNYDVGNYGVMSGVNYKNYVVIKGLPNVPSVIVPYGITLDYLNKVEFVVGDTFDYYVNVYPYNATNKDLTWSSSNEKVVTVDQKGTLKFVGEGTAKIKVKLNDYNLSDEIEVKVYPKVSGIKIRDGESVTFNRNKGYVLTADILPEGTLDQNIIWSTDAGKYTNDNGDTYDIISFDREYCGTNDNGYVTECKINQVKVYAGKKGKYTITATTEDGLYSDSIEINVIQNVTGIDINPDFDHYFASTLYMYLKESNKMDLKPKIYPEDATNNKLVYTSSDESIATVDDSGVVTAYKDGKVKITIKALEGDAKFEFNIMVFDNSVSTKVGDIDGDGEVGSLDLIKLRKHLAGLEAIE